MSQLVFIESIKGIHSTKHTKHTSLNLQPIDYRMYSYGTTYSLRKIKTREGSISVKKKAGRQIDIFPAGNRIVFRSWHTATTRLALVTTRCTSPSCYLLVWSTALTNTDFLLIYSQLAMFHSSSPSSPVAFPPPGPSKSSSSQ